MLAIIWTRGAPGRVDLGGCVTFSDQENSPTSIASLGTKTRSTSATLHLDGDEVRNENIQPFADQLYLGDPFHFIRFTRLAWKPELVWLSTFQTTSVSTA